MARCCLVFTSRRWVDGDPVSMPSPSHNHIPHHPLAQRPAISTTLSALIIQHNNKPSTTMSTAPGEWQKHFCACCCGGTCSSCLVIHFCPCYMHGKNYARLEEYPDVHHGHVKTFNGPCLVYCLTGTILGPLKFILTMMQRSDARDELNIRGNGCADCCVAFYCEPCAMAQMDTELNRRAPTTPVGALPYVSAVPYAQQPPEMVYAPQPSGVLAPPYGTAQAPQPLPAPQPVYQPMTHP
ncbi:hypothetical protein CLAFUW4_10571 [Fulvia fulva]|uniref:PLAC8-domain-containing protein n=1 Tax=Passalora fulva TaxID=5499 RepID=A0A9Q8LF45_PASFU|nr:uncharacterized protein CLAFUR5_05186 [Fulvia fulva]KAK4615776.1 hypothetical protein CLAFUR4_10576 [Fulvia fulva]KAK4617243.1 hypothetical protein CLAFUR0_10668 [Fulvia fulva]UJO16242.1 hypothetical protein CLAFUR5_05186 [Fulvia fulva]WPV19755.1 hypothetical protein CLAFUW4_10571 [Fulvia fulva]WPV34524.1 hypothetical protein CLAFUW7_10573 [Fulvia fulva]